MKYIPSIFIFSKYFFALLLFLITTKSYANSGGKLSAAQAAYDVKYYNLNLSINPSSKTINGFLLCRVEIISSINTLELDLDSVFTVDSILYGKNNSELIHTTFNHGNNKLNIDLIEYAEPENIIIVQIFYNGTPKPAVYAPWDGGFVWYTTQSGRQMVGVACEEDGADIWWPCKDHPSDEPDSMSLSFTVPNPFQCVSNGRFLGSVDNGDNTSTYNWFVSTPINNYNVTFYMAEYSVIDDIYQSVSGKNIPFYFWVLPEYYDQAVNYMDVFKTEFDFLESVFGAFPFGNDKHGWAQSSYYGMEHQTIIAYGSNFTQTEWGYDYIHLHEMAHEWWGNLITAKDWSDVWIHEGIATYAEALYVEHFLGKDKYIEFMKVRRPADNHTYPLAPGEPFTALSAFNYLDSYGRGASVMHTLRYYLGDDKFFDLLKRWLYPDPNNSNNTNGRLCRILSTEDMKNLAEEITGVELDNFWEVFFREASYPVLNVSRGTHEASFAWVTETNVPLDLNIPVVVNGVPRTVEMVEGHGTSEISINDDIVIDPEHWILMADGNIISSVEEENQVPQEYMLAQNYPNPFNPSSKINYSLPKASFVILNIYDILGKEVATIVNKFQQAGNYTVEFNISNLTSGIYFYRIEADNFSETKKMILAK